MGPKGGQGSKGLKGDKVCVYFLSTKCCDMNDYLRVTKESMAHLVTREREDPKEIWVTRLEQQVIRNMEHSHL